MVAVGTDTNNCYDQSATRQRLVVLVGIDIENCYNVYHIVETDGIS